MPAKAPAAKKPAEHPKYSEMVTAAVTALAEKKGSSRQAIVKYICTNYKVSAQNDTHVKLALKRMVDQKVLNQVSGKGASGSFKLAKKEAPKKAAPKKVAAKKAAPKKVAVKKAAPKKKAAAAKKSPKKAAKKTPKKTVAKKPATKKVTKKPVAKKAAKKAAAKKTKAKK